MKKVGSYGGSSNLTGSGGGYIKKKRFYIEEGSNLYRVLPPFGSLAEKSAIAKYHEIIWLKNSAGKKFPVSSKQVMGKDRVILKRDPIIDAINAKKQEFEMLKTNGADAALVNAMKEEIDGMNVDKAFYVNAMNPAGEIGVLKVKITAWNDLKTRLIELEKQGVDPINVGQGNGIVFDFKKQKDDKGKISYRVDVATRNSKDPATGRIKSEYQYLELDEALYTRMEKESEDLTKLYRDMTDEEQNLLASLDPKTVDRVFQRGQAVTTGEDALETVTAEEAEYVAPAPVKKATVQASTGTQQTSIGVTEPTQTTYVAPQAQVNDKVKAFLNSRKV
jgi:hypothetical protein